MKKIICLILTLTIVLSSFGAFSREYLPLYEYMDDVFKYDLRGGAEEESAELKDPDVNRLNLLQTFGIWDDAGVSKDALLTMTEFSVIMANLKLGADNALKGVYERETNANTEKVTYKNAYETLLETLGYYYRCAEFGNTDEAVLIVAADIGLIGEKPENINAYITRNELAKLIVRALNIDICVMENTSTGGFKYTVATGVTLLEKIHGVYDISGFVNAIPGLAVYGGTSVREGYIQIDRRNVNTSGLDLSAYLGARVCAYATYDAELKEYSIIYIDYAEDYTALTIDFADITAINNGLLYYTDEKGLEQEFDIQSLTYVTENGSKINSVADMSDYRTNEGVITFTASQKKGEPDTAIIYRYNYFVSSYADTRQQRIGLQFNQDYNGDEFVAIDDKAINDITLDGVKVDYSQIPSGAAFRYFKCEDTGYTQIIAYTKKVEGEVLSIYGDYVNISDTEYRKSADLKKIIEKGKDGTIDYSERVNEIELGLSTSFYVFENILVGYASTDTYRWGYLRSIKKDRTSIDPDLTLKILNEDSEWIELKIKDKFELDGQPSVTKDDFLSRVNNNIDIINNIVRYKVGKVGELAALDTIEQTRYEADSTDDVEFVYNFNSYIGWTYKWLAYDCPYILSENTRIFVIPAGEDDESKFKVVNNIALPSDSENNIPMKFYTPNEVHQIGAAVCTKDLGAGGSDGGYVDGLVYVENIRYALLDAENQEYGYKIIGKTLVRKETGILGSLAEKVFTVSEDLIDKNEVPKDDPTYDPNKALEVGDLISPAISGSIATSWSMVLKEGRVPALASTTPETDDSNFSTSNNGLYRGWGTVKKVDTVQQYILVDYEDRIQPLFAQCKVIIDPVDHKIELVTIADIIEGDKIWTSASNGRGLTIKNGDL